MAALRMQAHPMARSRFRAWVERVLPWYQEHTERLRNARSAVITRRAIRTTDLARQTLIDAYERADRERRR
jgi:hypothetical protein